MVAKRPYRLAALIFVAPVRVQVPNPEPVRLNVVLAEVLVFRQ